jgi:hypothetical protein
MRCTVRSRSLALAALLAAALPATAAAQRHASGGSMRGPQQPPIRVPPQPSIGLPLPEIVPPLPTLGLPPAGAQRPVQARPPRVNPPASRGNGHRGPGHGGGYYPIGGVGYVMPAFGWGWGYPAADPEPAPLSAPMPYTQVVPSYGTLRVEVLTAASAQVYVDGYYAGLADQAAAGLDLEEGPHRVEVRASGYEPLRFDVRITPNQVITFRDAMKPLTTAAAAPEPPPKPSAPSTFYVIPGCYIGNVAPEAARLPDGCDAKNVQTFKQ